MAVGVDHLERAVVREANASGMTWEQIGSIFGVSRQAVHRRYADQTVVPAATFDELVADLEEAGEPAPALSRAAARAQRRRA